MGFIPWPVVYMILVIIATYMILNLSRLGRHMYATGGNVKAAEFSGIRVKRIRRFIYAASGTMAALSRTRLH